MEPLVGKGGYLSLFCLTIDSLEIHDYLIFVGTIGNDILDEEQCKRLFSLPADIFGESHDIDKARIYDEFQRMKDNILEKINTKNANFFDEEMDKLDKWADDKKRSLQLKIKDIDDRTKELKRSTRTAPNLPQKVRLQKEIKNLERKRYEVWKEIDTASIEIEKQKEGLIDKIEKRFEQKVRDEELFSIEWCVV